MADKFHLEISDVGRTVQAFHDTGANLESIVNDVLHREAGPKIKNNIMPLLPRSGREWAGKKAAAKSVDPFVEKKENLAVTVTTKTNYHYLYFPDDGSNTIRHVGNQHFMYRGAQEAAPEIINLCTAKIINEIGGQ